MDGPARDPGSTHVLAINGGSSSIKFALYRTGARLERELHGQIDRIGLGDARLSCTRPPRQHPELRNVKAPDHAAAAGVLIAFLEEQEGFASVLAIGHRVVHGMRHQAPAVVTDDLLEELRRISPNDPEHLPSEIGLIEAFRGRRPAVPQVACFDTAFHHAMPRVARLLAIPRRFIEQGVQRYGFHGLSYAFLMEELARLGDPAAKTGGVILAHLGSGASLAAVRDGVGIDTSMGFTPTAGLPMGTRSGDLDPGLVGWLARRAGLDAAGFHHLVNHESGLLGVSGFSADMRDLLAKEAEDAHVADAVELFCYQVKKWIGAYAAALGGLHTLVFAGGIGEHAPEVRARACAGLGFLGIALDEARNAGSSAVISSATSAVTVRVIRTDEELMLARSVCRVLGVAGADDAA